MVGRVNRWVGWVWWTVGRVGWVGGPWVGFTVL